MKYSAKLTTIESAIIADAPSIGTFQREKGRVFTEGLMMGWFIYLNELLNLKNPMSPEQITLCAQSIVNEYYGMKISDLTLLFKNIISGTYGKFYERLSIADILSFFNDYMNERLDVAETISQRDHSNNKSMEQFNYSNNLRRIFDEGAKKSGKG